MMKTGSDVIDLAEEIQRSHASENQRVATRIAALEQHITALLNQRMQSALAEGQGEDELVAANVVMEVFVDVLRRRARETRDYTFEENVTRWKKVVVGDVPPTEWPETVARLERADRLIEEADALVADRMRGYGSYERRWLGEPAERLYCAALDLCARGPTQLVTLRRQIIETTLAELRSELSARTANSGEEEA